MKTTHFFRSGMLCVAVGFLMWSLPWGVPGAQDAAFESTKAAAEKGDAKAEYDLGRCYERGT